MKCLLPLFLEISDPLLSLPFHQGGPSGFHMGVVLPNTGSRLRRPSFARVRHRYKQFLNVWGLFAFYVGPQLPKCVFGYALQSSGKKMILSGRGCVVDGHSWILNGRCQQNGTAGNDDRDDDRQMRGRFCLYYFFICFSVFCIYISFLNFYSYDCGCVCVLP